MALSADEADIVRRLSSLHQQQRPHLKRLDAYFEGRQRLTMLGLSIPPELEQLETIVGWPATVVEAVDHRLDVEGFRLPGSPEDDDACWKIWQANRLGLEVPIGHLESLIFGRSYVAVGTRGIGPVGTSPLVDPTIPLVTVESPEEMIHEWDPRARMVSSALRRYSTRETLVRRREDLATLYLPTSTIWLERVSGQWNEADRDDHGLGVTPVVPLINQPRTNRHRGRSEMALAIQLTDAAARTLTNLQLATEILAAPQRWVFGVSKGEFADQNGKPIPAWETYLGSVWSHPNKDASAGQFSAADLRNFDTVMTLYGRLIAGLYGLPLRYMGENTANPPSADGIRADESRLIKRVERYASGLSESHELWMRIARRIQDGDWNMDLARMETRWRDPATPTKAQQTDAVVKLWSTGRYPTEAGWEDMGVSATRRAELRAMLDAEQRDPLTEHLLNGPPNGQPQNAPAGG